MQFTAETRGYGAWNSKFHPGLHEGVGVRTDHFVKSKISWMHIWPNFLTDDARGRERALLLLSRGRIPYCSAKIISFKIRLPAYLWGSIKVLAIQKRHQSKRIELCALGLCQPKVTDFPDEEKGIKLSWGGCHRMKVKMSKSTSQLSIVMPMTPSFPSHLVPTRSALARLMQLHSRHQAVDVSRQVAHECQNRTSFYRHQTATR